MSYTGTGPLGVNIQNVLTSQFDELSVTERTNQFQIKSTYGLTSLRNSTVEVSGLIYAENGVLYVSTSGSAPNAWAQLTTTEFGRYVPGSIAEGTIGITFDVESESDQRWGLYNPVDCAYDEGIGFGYNANSGLYTWFRKRGVETIFTSGDFNTISQDDLNAFNLNAGHVFRIRYAWYGYGEIIWEVQTKTTSSPHRTERKILHVYSPDVGQSISDPNQPLTASVDNVGNPSASGTIQVTGRSFVIYGKNESETRIVSERALNKTVSNSAFVPIISFRRKAGKSQNVKIQGVDIESNEKLLIQFRVDADPTTASWQTPSNHLPTETAMESDVAATTLGSGIVIFQSIAPASTRQSSALSKVSLPADIPAGVVVTLAARSLGGSPATADFVLRWTEEW